MSNFGSNWKDDDEPQLIDPTVVEVTHHLTHRKPKLQFDASELLSTGSTLLNLALTETPNGGYIKGCYYLYVGDSNAGKTWLGMAALAEASINPAFKNHRLIFDAPERGNIMDVSHHFGEALSNRIEPPAYDKKVPRQSRTVQDFYYHVDDAMNLGKPFIYVLDSMDSLDSVEDAKTFDERKEAAREGKEGPGSYGTAKAKANSSGLRTVTSRLQELESIIIMISQTRDSITTTGKTRSGGKAMKFYATAEVWLSIANKEFKTYNGNALQVGVVAKAEVKRTRVTGKIRDVELPIYWAFGIDDLGSCVDYLAKWKKWKKADKGGRVTVTNFFDKEYTGSVDQIVAKVEAMDFEQDLRQLVYETWLEVEEHVTIERKPRYV